MQCLKDRRVRKQQQEKKNQIEKLNEKRQHTNIKYVANGRRLWVEREVIPS